MLQQKKPDDYVIASGKQYSVKYFISLVCKELRLQINWKGQGLNEKAYLNKKNIISIDKRYFRPTEVDSLLGNSKKASKVLKWTPKNDINSLVKDMVSEEMKFLNA